QGLLQGLKTLDTREEIVIYATPSNQHLWMAMVGPRTPLHIVNTWIPGSLPVRAYHRLLQSTGLEPTLRQVCGRDDRVDLLHYPLQNVESNIAVPYIITVHALIHETLPNYDLGPERMAKRRRAVEQAVGIITVSAYTRDAVMDFYGIAAAKIRVIPCGVDLA